MLYATAAYCSACQAHVFVAADGSCEFGHERLNLRGIYSAGIDRRTGRPLPPGFDQRASMTRPVAPIAPVALSEYSSFAEHTPYDTSRLSITAPSAPVISAMGASALPRTLVVSGAQGGLRRMFGLRIGRAHTRHGDSIGLVSVPLLATLAAVSVLAIAVSVAL